jgi:hypothetical protein
MKLYELVLSNIIKCNNKDELSDIIWKPYFENNSKCSKKCGKGLKILLLNAPCNGFGDLIFALKLSNYLKEWYDAEVTLATTLESGLLNLGADPNYTVGLIGGSKMQCRRFKNMKLNKTIPIQDLILVAPMQIDFIPNLSDVKGLIPYANILNTFYFSEYNDELNKNFTFNTGVGKNRDGVLLTKYVKKSKKTTGLKNPYAVIYVAGTLERVDKCILSFLEMISKKYYKKHKKLDIVIPNWFVDWNVDEQFLKTICKYYPNIVQISKNKNNPKDTDNIIIASGHKNDNLLTFRCDILPVPNKLMVDLMANSIKDILLTGDQSITDAISCCYKKNIFYQIAPWKRDLAKNLSKEMPNVYLKSEKTSCGTLRAIKYNSNYEKFRNKWDFRIKGKPKMDSIVLSILAIKNDKQLLDLYNKVSTGTLRSIKNNLLGKRPRRVSGRKSRRRKSVSRRKSRRRKSVSGRKSRSKK